MHRDIEASVERAIDVMRQGLDGVLTLDDLARAAMFSKYHFSRMFLQTTGVSPGRFLSAMRLAEAKRLLRKSSCSVADISHQVGYNSVGTFSTRFGGSVGVSPRSYRAGACAITAAPYPPLNSPAGAATVGGRITADSRSAVDHAFIGLFPGRLVEGVPSRFATLDGAGAFNFGDVPAGTWYVLTHSVGCDLVSSEYVVLIGAQGPLRIGRTGAYIADIQLHRKIKIDPPLLTAMPYAESRAASVRNAGLRDAS